MIRHAVFTACCVGRLVLRTVIIPLSRDCLQRSPADERGERGSALTHQNELTSHQKPDTQRCCSEHGQTLSIMCNPAKEGIAGAGGHEQEWPDCVA